MTILILKCFLPSISHAIVNVFKFNFERYNQNGGILATFFEGTAGFPLDCWEIKKQVEFSSRYKRV